MLDIAHFSLLAEQQFLLDPASPDFVQECTLFVI
jgi:hypothetical protein